LRFAPTEEARGLAAAAGGSGGGGAELDAAAEEREAVAGAARLRHDLRLQVQPTLHGRPGERHFNLTITHADLPCSARGSSASPSAAATYGCSGACAAAAAAQRSGKSFGGRVEAVAATTHQLGGGRLSVREALTDSRAETPICRRAERRERPLVVQRVHVAPV